MKNSTQRVQNILLAAAVALPLFAATSAARADEADAGAPAPAMQGEPHGGPDSEPGERGGPRHGGSDGRDSDRGGPDHGGPDNGGPDRGPRARFGPPPFGGSGGPGMGGRPPFMHGVELTEAQQDKVFAILHAEQPYLRDQGKAAAKAQEALHAMARADKYDDAKAAALSKEAATAMANIALQHVRTEQKLLAVLTAEQRKQQAEKRPKPE